MSAAMNTPISIVAHNLQNSKYLRLYTLLMVCPVYFYLEWIVSLQVPLKGKGENLKEIKVGLTFVDGIGSGYSATCQVTTGLPFHACSSPQHGQTESSIAEITWDMRQPLQQ